MKKFFYTFSFRQRFAIGLVLATVFFIIMCLIASHHLSRDYTPNNIKESATNISNNITSSVSGNDPTYVIKSYEGKVSVFEKGKGTPIRVTDTLIDKLPQKDQEILKSGIEVNSQKDVANVLEDFCS